MDDTDLLCAVFDAYPSHKGDQIERFSCAIVRAYATSEAVFNREVTYDRISEMVSAEGWILTERIQAFSTVTDIPLEIARDAIEEGVSFGVERLGIERKYRSKTDHAMSVRAALNNFVATVRETGEIHVYDKGGEDQLAKWTGESGDSIVPLWSDHENAIAWRDEFAGFSLVRISIPKFTDVVVPQMLQRCELAFIGADTTELISVHPKSVSDKTALSYS